MSAQTAVCLIKPKRTLGLTFNISLDDNETGTDFCYGLAKQLMLLGYSAVFLPKGEHIMLRDVKGEALVPYLENVMPDKNRLQQQHSLFIPSSEGGDLFVARSQPNHLPAVDYSRIKPEHKDIAFTVIKNYSNIEDISHSRKEIDEMLKKLGIFWRKFRVIATTYTDQPDDASTLHGDRYYIKNRFLKHKDNFSDFDAHNAHVWITGKVSFARKYEDIEKLLKISALDECAKKLLPFAKLAIFADHTGNSHPIVRTYDAEPTINVQDDKALVYFLGEDNCTNLYDFNANDSVPVKCLRFVIVPKKLKAHELDKFACKSKEFLFRVKSVLRSMGLVTGASKFTIHGGFSAEGEIK